MDIGKEKEIITVEPLRDPFKRDAPPREPEPLRESTPEPERGPVTP